MFLFLVLQAFFSKILAGLLQLSPRSKATDVFRLKLNGLTACKLIPLYFTLPLLTRERSFKNINHNPTPHHRVNFPALFTSVYLCHHTLSPSCHYLLDRQVGLFMKCCFSIPLVLLSLVPDKAASFDRVPLYCYHISQNTGWVCTTPELWVLCHHLTLGLIFLCSALYPTFSAPDTFSSFPTKGPAFLSTQGFSWRLFPHCFLPSSLLPILPSKVRRHVATFLTPMPVIHIVSDQ